MRLAGLTREVTEAGLAELARVLWEDLPPGSVVHLVGELGAGKTALVKSLARVAGAAPAASPTFQLVHRYDTAHGPILHADCYRIRDPAEAVDLDLWAEAARARLLLIEWPERGGEHVPPADVVIRFGHTGDPELRTVKVEA